MVDTETKQIIRDFVDTLAKKGVRIEHIILYGSHASGSAHRDSDLDVAIVSPDFGKDRFEEGKLLLRTAWRVDPRLQPVPISSEAFKKNTWIPLIHEIREKGIEIKAA